MFHVGFARGRGIATACGFGASAPLGRILEAGLEGALARQLDDPGGGDDDARVESQVAHPVLRHGAPALLRVVIGRLPHSEKINKDLWGLHDRVISIRINVSGIRIGSGFNQGQWIGDSIRSADP